VVDSATARSAGRTRMGRLSSKSDAVECCQRMHALESADEFRQQACVLTAHNPVLFRASSRRSRRRACWRGKFR
jgi:hypothetical protein